MPRSLHHFAGCTDADSVRARFLHLTKIHHPDRGGDAATFTEVKQEYEAVMAALAYGFSLVQQPEPQRNAPPPPPIYREEPTRLVPIYVPMRQSVSAQDIAAMGEYAAEFVALGIEFARALASRKRRKPSKGTPKP